MLYRLYGAACAMAVVAVVLLYRNVVKKRRAQAALLKQIEKANVSLEESVKNELAKTEAFKCVVA